MSVDSKRTIRCDIKSCKEQLTEKEYGDGWPKWGEIHGKKDTETGSTSFGLCPKHLEEVFDIVLKL